MQKYFIKGSSSLLFIISTKKAFNSSNFISWKYCNVFLIFASFLCNATEYKPIFLLLDYLAIYLTCISYINNIYINIPYSLLLIYEYKKYKSIENMKNVAFLSAMGKTILYTYLYLDKNNFIIVITSSISGLIIYKIRNSLNEIDNIKYNLLLTYLFHFCVMNMLYISSITAV